MYIFNTIDVHKVDKMINFIFNKLYVKIFNKIQASVFLMLQECLEN